MAKLKKSTRKITVSPSGPIVNFFKAITEKDKQELFQLARAKYGLELRFVKDLFIVKGNKDISHRVYTNFLSAEKNKSAFNKEKFFSCLSEEPELKIQEEIEGNNNLKSFILRHKDQKTTLFKPKTDNQLKLMELIEQKKIIFAGGPAGTGKTLCGLAMAIKYLQQKKVARVILTRPNVTSEDFGYLPGSAEEKMLPFLYPIMDSLNYLVGKERKEEYLAKGDLEILPVAYSRGITIGSMYFPTIGLIDEAQNLTYKNLKLMLTRIGDHPNSKLILCGDSSQSDLGKKECKDFEIVKNILKDSPYVGVLDFEADDVVRSVEVKDIVARFEDYENTNGAKNAR